MPPAAPLLCAIVAALGEPRYIVVPDPHQFVSGFTLKSDERLVVTRCGNILRADGYPDQAKLKEVLS